MRLRTPINRTDAGRHALSNNKSVPFSLKAVGGGDKPLARELQRLAGEFASIQTMTQLDAPLVAIKGYLKDIQ